MGFVFALTLGLARFATGHDLLIACAGQEVLACDTFIRETVATHPYLGCVPLKRTQRLREMVDSVMLQNPTAQNLSAREAVVETFIDTCAHD